MQTPISRSIVQWLENHEDMHYWDLICALPLTFVMQLLQKAYERRVADGSVPNQLQGTVCYDDLQISYFLDNYRIDAPILAIENPSYNRPTVSVEVALEQGAQVATNLRGEIFSVRTHRTVNPLRPKLELALEHEQGGLRVDLRKASDYALDLGGGELAPSLGKQMATQMFQRMDIAHSSLPLMRVLPNGANPFLTPSKIHVRSQASPDDQRQAVLLFMTLEHGVRGHDPVDGTGFPVLLSDDPLDEESGTALVARRVAHQVAYAQAIRAVVEDARWEYVQDEFGRTAEMHTGQGVIHVPPGRSRNDELEFESFAFDLSAGDGDAALSIRFHDDRVEQTWQPSCHVTYRYRKIGDDQWTTEQIALRPRLNYRFTLEANSDRESGRLESTAEGWSLARASSLAEQDETLALLADYSIRRGFINALSERLSAKVVGNLLSMLRVEEGQALVPAAMEIPGHLAVQGVFQRAGEALRIVQQAVRLAPGELHRFTTRPERQGVEWRWEALPGYPFEPGTLDPRTGEYRAPTAEQLKGNTLRVRIVAFDPASDERHDAQVTVVGAIVNVEPALQVIQGTDAAREIQLHAFKMSLDTVDWSMTNIEGGQGGNFESSGDTALYTVEKHETESYCSIDKIEAWGQDMKGLRVGVPATGVMLRLYQDPSIEIIRADEPSLEGELQLEGWINGRQKPVHWYLPLGGPGEIDQDGLYRADSEAPDSYVVVRASETTEGRERHGHIILPLPLSGFAGVQALQLRRARQVRAGAAEHDSLAD